MDSFEDLLFGLFNNNRDTLDIIGNDIVGDYTIDTCDTLDAGYETAIWKNGGEIVIVQRYPDKNAAEKGHAIWCGICELNPTKIYSVQTERYEIL